MSVTMRELRLVGAGGEPVDLVRTLNSHGFVDLPPMKPDPDYRATELTVRTRRGKPRHIRIESGRRGYAKLSILGPASSSGVADDVTDVVRYVLRLDADLSSFYAAAADDEQLSWVTTGAGRMVRSASVFEDVVKTICTTNCTWSATASSTWNGSAARRRTSSTTRSSSAGCLPSPASVRTRPPTS